MQQEGVAAIPKSAQARRRSENIDVFDFELSGEEMQAIHRLDREERLVDGPAGMVWER